jgi:hypothetical protein
MGTSPADLQRLLTPANRLRIGAPRVIVESAAEHQHGRPRRRFAALAWGVTIFASLQLGLAWAVESGVCDLRDPIFAHKFDRLRRCESFFPAACAFERPATILVLGSSRALIGLRAGQLSDGLSVVSGRPTEVFNFGVSAAGPVTNAVYLRRLLAQGVRSDSLVIEVMPAFLNGRLPQPYEFR